MIKQLAWNTFKNTGNINTYMELIQFQNMEKEMNLNNNQYLGSNEYLKVKEYGDNKDQGLDNFRE